MDVISRLEAGRCDRGVSWISTNLTLFRAMSVGRRGARSQATAGVACVVSRDVCPSCWLPWTHTELLDNISLGHIVDNALLIYYSCSLYSYLQGSEGKEGWAGRVEDRLLILVTECKIVRGIQFVLRSRLITGNMPEIIH